ATAAAAAHRRDPGALPARRPRRAGAPVPAAALAAAAAAGARHRYRPIAARRAPAPGAGRARPDLRQVRPDPVDAPGPAAARRGGRAVAAAGPGAAVSR